MQILPTPTPSPTPEGSPRQLLPSHNLEHGVYPSPASVGYAHAFSGNNVATVDGFLAVAADHGVESPHPSVLQPLHASPPQVLFVPLPPIVEAVGHLSTQNAAFAPRAITSHRPPTPSPEQQTGMSRAGYIYDLHTAYLPRPPSPDSCLYITVQPFLPSVSYAQGPLHACDVLHPSMTAGAPSVNADRGAEQVQHGVLVCNVCDKVFNNEAAARAHARVHGPSDLYVCGECGARFASESERETHWVQRWGCRDGHKTNVKIAAADAIRNWHKDMLEAAW